MKFATQRQKFFFYSIPTFLFVLIPIFLISGPFLSDLSISIIASLFLIYSIKNKDFHYFKNKFFYIFIIFWLYLFLNSLLNNFNIDSIKISFFYIRFGIFVLAIIALINFDDKFIKYFFYCLIFCFLLLIIDGFVQYFFEKNLTGLPKAANHRISSFFGNELILGSYLSRLWPIFFCLSFYYYYRSNKFLIFIILFILSEVLIFLSGERTAFFYINLSAVFVILFSKNLKKLRGLTLILSSLTIIIVSFFNPSAKNRIIDQTINQIKNPSSSKIYIFSEQHTHHYISAYKMFLDNKLFGVGVKNFRNFCGNEKYKVSELSCSTHPHNTYLQIISETGFIGLIFILIVLFTFIYHTINHIRLAFRNKKYFNDLQICILSGILITLWPFAPTGNVFNNWLNVLYFLYLPFLYWTKKKTKIRSAAY